MGETEVDRVAALMREAQDANQHMALTPLVEAAADLMASQQAMPDEGALQMLRILVRRAYELGKHAHELDDGTWTVLGVWENGEAIPVGAIRGTHDVYGESPGERASTEPGFTGFDTSSFYEQGVWAASVSAPDADTAQVLAAEEIMREDEDEDEREEG